MTVDGFNRLYVGSKDPQARNLRFIEGKKMQKAYEFICPLNLMRSSAKDIQVKFISELVTQLKFHPVSPVLWWYIKSKKVKYAGVSMIQIAEEATIIFRSLPNELPPYMRFTIDAYDQAEDTFSDQLVEGLICSCFCASMIRS